MKSLMLLAIIIFLMQMTSEAKAENWQTVATGVDGTIFEVDLDTENKNNDFGSTNYVN